MQSAFLSLSILVLSFVLYQSLVVVPKEKMELQKQSNIETEVKEEIIKSKKASLLKSYKECKSEKTAHYNFEWLRQCDFVKKLSPECKKLLDAGYPWELFYLYNSHIDNGYEEYTKEAYIKYSTFTEKLEECSCETLPSVTAEKLNEDHVKQHDRCLKEFETMIKAL